MGNDKAPTLTEFLLARISEREAIARAASQMARDGSMARWRNEYRDGGNPGQSRVWNGVGQAVVNHVSDSQGAHIALHDPARVLAECEAQRAVVRQGRMFIRQSDDLPDTDENARQHGAATAYEEVLGYLALPDADHPDYQEKWRP